MKFDITRISYNQDVSTAPKRILSLFLAFYIIYPMIFLLIVSFTIGLENFMAIALIVILLCIPIIPSSTVAFLLINRKLKRYLDQCRNDPESLNLEAFQNFINKYPFRASLTIFIGFVTGTFLAILMAHLRGVTLSYHQTLFLLILGEVPALVITWAFYYYCKISLYPTNRVIQYKPLSVFYKLYIPLISTILMLLNITNLGIYKLIEGNVNDSQAKILRETTLKTGSAIDARLQKTLSEIAMAGVVIQEDELTYDNLKPYLERMKEHLSEDTGVHYIVDRRGSGFTGTGKALNISGKKYFRRVLETGKPVISKITECIADSKPSIIMAAPILQNGGVTGVVGASVDPSLIRKTIESSTELANYMVTEDDGIILFHNRTGYQGKVLGREIADTQDGFSNINDLHRLEELKPLEVTFNGEKMVSLRYHLPLYDKNLILFKNHGRYYEAINNILIRLSITFFFIVIVSSFIIREIARQIGDPVRRTVRVFQKFSDGDLTIEANTYIPDEFGEIMRNLEALLVRMNEIILTIQELVSQLNDSALILTKTSQNLSDNAGEQAASVEETSASLEETLSSIESVEQSSREQDEATRISFESMNHLKEKVKEVTNYSREALSMADETSGEAERGNELMNNVIQGMNRIDTSTSRISEFVTRISDISDQVNLLALNASIEAARAGEHGRGFAVVADEISKLADETSGAARNITDLVSTGRNEVKSGLQIVDSASQSLQTIIDNVRKTSELVHSIGHSAAEQDEESSSVLEDTRRVKEMSEFISRAMNEQALSNHEIYKAVERINLAAQHVSDGSNDLAGFTRDIQSKSEQLSELIAYFTVRASEED